MLIYFSFCVVKKLGIIVVFYGIIIVEIKRKKIVFFFLNLININVKVVKFEINSCLVMIKIDIVKLLIK